MVKNNKINSISLDGGTLCLDFVNTVRTRKENPPPSYLEDMNELLAWAERLAIIDSKAGKQLESFSLDHPRKADQFFKEAMELRELLYSVFYAISTGKKLANGDLQEYNKWLSHYFTAIRLTNVQGEFTEGYNFSPDDFSQITVPIIRDSYELLLSGKLDRVRECPNCG